MQKIVYRIMSLAAALAVALGGAANAKATPASADPEQQATGGPRVYAYYCMYAMRMRETSGRNRTGAAHFLAWMGRAFNSLRYRVESYRFKSITKQQ